MRIKYTINESTLCGLIELEKKINHSALILIITEGSVKFNNSFYVLIKINDNNS